MASLIMEVYNNKSGSGEGNVDGGATSEDNPKSKLTRKKIKKGT